MTERVDKAAMACNKPKRTPGHPEKSHIVKACYDGKEKIIRFGEQGKKVGTVSGTAGKPKAGESDRMKAKRKSFKARHAKNIAKGPSSAAYWANKVKWADGGHVELSKMLADYEGADDLHHLVQKFKTGGQPKKDKEPGLMDYLQSVANTVTSLPEAPAAIYNAGKEFFRAIPQAARTAAGYINNTPLTKVGQDVRRGASTVAGGLNTIARQARQNPVGAAKTAASTALDVIPVIGDIKAYGQDVSTAARMRASGDVSGAQNIERMALPLAIASIAPGVGEARMAGKAARAAEEAGQLSFRGMGHNGGPSLSDADVVRPGTKIMKRPASFPVDYGRPQGNLNLRPNIDPVTLKGAEVQDVESLINQLRGRPGVTKQGLERVASGFKPGEKVTAAQFGERLPRSYYHIEDLETPTTDYFDQIEDDARHMVNQNRDQLFYDVADDLGLGRDYGRVIQDLYDNGYREGDADHDLVMGLVGMRHPGQDPEEAIGGLYMDHFYEAVDGNIEYLQDLAQDGAYGDQGGYKYREHQRLVPNEMRKGPGYFEAGVSHPELGDMNYNGGEYRNEHYPEHSDELVGHIRGTFNPKNLLGGVYHYGSNFSSPATLEEALGGSAQRGYTFRPKPNSMVIEELQSDAAKHYGDTGPLHQIHGTLFKAAIQKALEGGVDTVYMPTAKAIGLSRYMHPKDFQSIYDKEVVKYGLNPLREISGVEINPIDDMYHEITISPEAREFILKGAGQKAPGYADGGLVSTYDEAKVSNLADQIREGIYG